MNEDELKGGARYVGGKLEKAVGDAVDSRDWKVDGVIDQVAGAAQHGYGRVRSVVEDAIDSAPELAAEAGDRLRTAADRATAAARDGGRVASRTVEDSPVLWAIAAAMGGYALAWLVHGRRD